LGIWLFLSFNVCLTVLAACGLYTGLVLAIFWELKSGLAPKIAGGLVWE
jgi:hypothetical protein